MPVLRSLSNSTWATRRDLEAMEWRQARTWLQHSITTSTTSSTTGVCLQWTDDGAIVWTDSNTSATSTGTFSDWVIQAQVAEDIAAWAKWVNRQNGRIEVRESQAEREQRQQRERQAAEQYRITREAAERERKIAEVRAKRLLIENISQAQRKSLKEKGYFDVSVKGRTYRIKWGSHGNVYLVVDGREVRSFCIQPPDVPQGDAMLAQKLLLETDEQSFLKIANARDIVAPLTPAAALQEIAQVARN